MVHMLSFETIANLISLAVIASLAGIYFFGKQHFEPAAKDQDPKRNGRANP